MKDLMADSVQEHTYRIQVHGDAVSRAREIKFWSSDAERALNLAQQHCGAQPSDLYEDGRRLATLRLSSSGFWVVS
jgi:hypothetical protein